MHFIYCVYTYYRHEPEHYREHNEYIVNMKKKKIIIENWQDQIKSQEVGIINKEMKVNA